MNRQLLLALAAAAVSVGVLLGFLFLREPDSGQSRQADVLGDVETAPPDEQQTAAEAAVPGAQIDATVFFAAPDGNYLVPVPREVPLAGDAAAQGREIVLAQLAPAPAPLISPIPPGTTLRGFFVTDRGNAYVDLGGAVVTGHPGGSAAEVLTVFAIVHAVTASLPGVDRVQVLVNGQEVDSLVGHVDLRQPLSPDPSLVKQAAD